jgi:three-Cys-motif partner protein
MPSIKSTIWSIDPHTQAKHEILRNYLKAWFPILGTTAGRIIYLDGFAGPGIYKGGEEGSPIIAIKTARDHVLRSKFKAEIIFWFIERDSNRATKLKEVLQDRFPSLPDKMSYEVEGAEFAPTLESVLDEMEEKGARLAPTFAFLDPFGFSGLPMELIQRFLTYKKCEVLITFMSGFVNRFPDDIRERVLNDLYGTPKWKKVNEIKNSEERRNFLIGLYKEQLNKNGAKYVLSFEMVGKTRQVIYDLVFGTKHRRGLEVMKEAMWGIDTRGTYRFSDTTDVNQKYLTDYSESHWVPDAARRVFKKFRGKTVPIEEVEDYIWVKTPFKFRKKILIHLEKAEPSRIDNVSNRQRRFTYPDGCIITFKE